jgi:hypothetical protein
VQETVKEGSAVGPDAAKAEFSEQCPLVDSLEKSGARVIGDLKDGTPARFRSEN